MSSICKQCQAENSFRDIFREYFYTRGNLVCEPAQDDDSFSSQPDDFESSNEYQKLDTSSSASSHEIENIINQSSNMSESLLFCLDGNNVTSTSTPSPAKSRKRQHDDTDGDSSSETLKRPLIDSDVTDL